MRGQASALEPLRTSRRGHQRRATRVSLARIVQQRRAHEPAHGPLESGARHSRDATWRARKSTTSATGIAVSAALCARPGRALLSAGRPKHTDQGRTNRHARASPLPQLHMRKGVNRNPSRRPELADSDSNLHAVKMTQNWALLTPPLSHAAGPAQGGRLSATASQRQRAWRKKDYSKYS